MSNSIHRSGLAAVLGLALAAATLGSAAQAQSSPESDSLAARLAELSGKLEGMTEQLQTLQADTDKLKRFKFSGYLQARWETTENKSDSVKVAGNPAVVTPANTERFYIRRGRLKLTYDSSPLSQAVVYFDGGTDRTVRLLEAYVTLLDPWTLQHRHGLTVGQMNVPFGWELERSSSVRELPERSRAENVLFSGERDRGLKLVSQWTDMIQTTLGVFNGGGINDPEFPNTDPTRGKDLAARLRVAQGVVDGGVSWYDGTGIVALTGGDLETERTRLGLDAEAYYELPLLGGGSLRGEYYGGRNANADSVRVLVVAPTAGNPVRLLRAGANADHLTTDFRGGYLMWVQNLGEKLQGAVRYDVFDPNTDVDHDQFDRVGLGINYFYDGFTRLTVSYDIPKTDRARCLRRSEGQPVDRSVPAQILGGDP